MQTFYTIMTSVGARMGTSVREIGMLLPNNQRQQIQKELLPYALC